MELNCCLKSKAFSLLEVIIAVSILSIGIVVILQAFSFSARLTGLSADIINAVFLSEDKIQELEFKAAQGLIDREPRQLKDKNNKFQWQYLLVPEPSLNLYRLDFDVSWQRANRQEALKLTTYLRQ